MNTFTKTFIQNNYQKINDNEWYKVFDEWYNSTDEIWPDTSAFEEIIKVLETANVNVDWSKRDELLYDKYVDMFTSIKADTTVESNKFVSYRWLAGSLKSKLGANFPKLKYFMKHAAKVCGFDDNVEEMGFNW